MENKSVVISIDAGNVQSGVAVVTGGVIDRGYILPNEDLFGFILACSEGYSSVTVLIEDIKPYSLKLSQQVIDTCKFIGVLSWRLDVAKIAYSLISRFQIKQWCFNEFKAILEPLIDKKIQYRKLINKDGIYRKASFAFVDDRMVAVCMREFWKIEKPNPGRKQPQGLSSHSWQALALTSFYLSSHGIINISPRDTFL